MRERHAILVLGMHRSGTSALTRTLGLCGATLPKRRMQATPGDPETDYWESRSVCALHEELLASIGLSALDACEVPQAWFQTPAADHFKRRLITALDRDFGVAPLIAVKDPRACRLVPMWLSIFEDVGIKPFVIIPVRDPTEVAMSLKVRNGIPIENSLLIWLRHFLAAERDSRAVKRSFVAYADLLKNWRGVIDKIGTDLNLRWPDRSPAAALQIDRFLRLDLNHHGETMAAFRESSDNLESANAAYDWAMRAVESLPADAAVLDRISDCLVDATPRPRPILWGFSEDRHRHGKLRNTMLFATWRVRYVFGRACHHAMRVPLFLFRNGPNATAARIVKEFRRRLWGRALHRQDSRGAM